MLLEFPEARFDIVCMDNDVPIGEGDPEIPQMGEEVGHDCAKGANKLCAVFGGGHEVDGDGIRGRALGCVENELVLPSLLDEVELRGEKDMWCELSDPGQEQDNEIVLFLFVHGFHDFVEFFHDGWVVAMLPIGHEVFPHAVCIENIGTPGCHDVAIMLQQFAIHIWQDAPNNIIDIPVCCSVITVKITHYKAGVHVVMEEAGKEPCGLV